MLSTDLGFIIGTGDPNVLSPLLVLHGFTHHSHLWDTFADALKEQYRVLVPDLRGHGETQWSSDYFDESMVSDIERFIQALDLDRFVLLGHSMGGSIGYVLAARHPDLFDRLILVESGPKLPGGEPPGPAAPSIEKSAESFEDTKQAVALARTLVPMADETELRNQIVHNLVRAEDTRWTWRYDRFGFRRDHPEISVEERWEMLSKINCPTLLILGAKSPFNRERAKRMTQVIPRCRIVEIPESGHSPQRDNPKAFLDPVRGFLKE